MKIPKKLSLCSEKQGFGIRDPKKTYSRSRIQGSKSTQSRIPDPDPQHCFKEVFFLSFGPKIFFSVELLRPLVSVNKDFLKFFIFYVLKKLSQNLTSLRVCSGLYAYAEHTHQELVRKLSIRARNWCAC